MTDLLFYSLAVTFVNIISIAVEPPKTRLDGFLVAFLFGICGAMIGREVLP